MYTAVAIGVIVGSTAVFCGLVVLLNALCKRCRRKKTRVFVSYVPVLEAENE